MSWRSSTSRAKRTSTPRRATARPDSSRKRQESRRRIWPPRMRGSRRSLRIPWPSKRYNPRQTRRTNMAKITYVYKPADGQPDPPDPKESKPASDVAWAQKQGYQVHPDQDACKAFHLDAQRTSKAEEAASAPT